MRYGIPMIIKQNRMICCLYYALKISTFLWILWIGICQYDIEKFTTLIYNRNIHVVDKNK